MKTQLKTLKHILILTGVLAIASNGCFLKPPPRSALRAIHQYAEAGDVTNVAAYLATNSAGLNLPDDAGLTPLHLAAGHCRTNVVALLLDKGAKVNQKAQGGATPLHLAAQEGCGNTVKMLLEKGAKVNARDDEGRTALKRAEQWQQDSTATLIRLYGGTE
jgi:ankyrin repeat protein